MANLERKAFYCGVCDKLINSKHHNCKNFISLEVHDEQCTSKIIEGVDYIECKLCGSIKKNIKGHLKAIHSEEITTDEYEVRFGPLIASKTREKYKERNKYNSNWIQRRKLAGDDLLDYRKRMGISVRESIMSNPAERERRSKLAVDVLGSWAKSNVGRMTSSKTATRTSARIEILNARSKRLHRSRKASFGERSLERFLIPMGFKRSHHVHDERFETRTHRRIVDFAHLEKMVFIEFDGAQHFNRRFPNQDLNVTLEHDRALNDWSVETGYTMIRISHDQVKDNEIRSACLVRLQESIDSVAFEEPRLILIGNAYMNCSGSFTT